MLSYYKISKFMEKIKVIFKFNYNKFCYLILIIPGLYFFDNPMLSRYWFFILLIIYLIIYLDFIV